MRENLILLMLQGVPRVTGKTDDFLLQRGYLIPEGRVAIIMYRCSVVILKSVYASQQIIQLGRLFEQQNHKLMLSCFFILSCTCKSCAWSIRFSNAICAYKK